MTPHRNELDAALARISALEREANRDDGEIARLKGEVERLRNPDPEATRAKAARRRTLMIGVGVALLVTAGAAAFISTSRKGPLSDVNALAVTLPGGKPAVLVKGYDGRSARLDVYDLTRRQHVGSWSVSGRGGVRAFGAAGDGAAWIRRRASLEKRALPSLDTTMVRTISASVPLSVDGRSGELVEGHRHDLRRCKHGVVRAAALKAPDACKPQSDKRSGALVGALATPGADIPVVRPLSFAVQGRFVSSFVASASQDTVYSFRRSLAHDGRALYRSKHGGKPERLAKTYALTQPAFVVDPRYGLRVIALPNASVLVAHRQGADVVLDAIALVDGSRRWRRALGVVDIAACFRAGANGPLAVVTRGKQRSDLLLIDAASGAISWQTRL